jgi:prepilin-type N-terminal cleavage/methylation domain-containing protein
MKRAGFTMIELIFVIVILGILSAVALPKFIGVSEQARASKCNSFVGTLNRTVLPAIWSEAMADGASTNTAVQGYFTEANLNEQIKVPDGCGIMANYAARASSATTGGTVTITIGAENYSLDTNTTAGLDNAPVLRWYK